MAIFNFEANSISLEKYVCTALTLQKYEGFTEQIVPVKCFKICYHFIFLFLFSEIPHEWFRRSSVALRFGHENVGLWSRRTTLTRRRSKTSVFWCHPTSFSTGHSKIILLEEISKMLSYKKNKTKIIKYLWEFTDVHLVLNLFLP